MDKHAVLLESVQKLLALDLSEKEVIQHLVELGITQSEAEGIIAEVKGEKAPTPKPVSNPSPIPAKPVEGPAIKPVSEGFKPAKPGKTWPVEPEPNLPESMLTEEELIGSAKEENNYSTSTATPVQSFTPPPKPVVEPPRTPSLYDQVLSSTQNDPVSAAPAVWDEAILTSMDQKLEEMRRIRSELDTLIDSKVDERMNREQEKIRALFDAQKNLFSAKIASELKAKTLEVDELISGRIKEFKTLNDSIQRNISTFDAKKQLAQDLLSSVSDKLADMEVTKKRMVSELSSEALAIRQQNDAFLQESSTRMKESDARITRTLELESKITDGLVRSAEQKIEQLVDARMKVVEARANQVVAGITEVEKRVDFANLETRIKGYQKQLDAITSFKQDMAQLQQQLQDVETIKERFLFLQRSAQDLETKLSEFKQFRQQFLALQTDSESFKQSVKEFGAFKDQFVAVVAKNTEKLNASIKEFNDSKSSIEKTINDKIAELDLFEKNFAQEMGIHVETLLEKREKEKSPKSEKKSAPEKPAASTLEKVPSRPGSDDAKSKKKPS